MNLKKLISDIHAVYSGADLEVKLITERLEEVKEGALFVCVKGRHTDGHELAVQAVQKGACAVVCERDLGLARQIIVENTRNALALMSATFYGKPAEALPLVGVTGTNGKTTTAFWIRSMLERAGQKTALIGTLGADSGDGFEQTQRTTPDSVVFNRKLREALDANCKYAVAEISSQALSQERCAGLPFAVAVFTNLSAEHLDYHGTMESYAAEKAKLFGRAKTAVINADDPYAATMLKSCTGSVITYSLRDDADLTAKNIVCKTDGVSYILVSREGLFRVHVTTPGVFSVYNSMAAVAACMALGIDFEKACSLVNEVPPVPGRMQRILPSAPFSVYVDYAHTPAALHEVLYALRQTTAGKLIVVFGCGGERDAEKRPKMGEIASALADITVLTDDNPREEDPHEIITQIANGFQSEKTLLIEHDRKKAIESAFEKAMPGDSILIAGKGHEKMQYTANGALAFDDVAVAQALGRAYVSE